MKKAIALIIIIMLLTPFICFSTETYDPHKMNKELVNALIAFIKEIVIVLESVLETDVSNVLKMQISESIRKCNGRF